MKSRLALLCAALGAVGGAAQLVGVPREAFASIHEGSLFGACLNAVKRGEAPGVPFTKACVESFSAYGGQASALGDDCAELAGRSSEAADEGYLGDGRLLCGRMVRERAVVSSRPLAAFTPTEGGA